MSISRVRSFLPRDSSFVDGLDELSEALDRRQMSPESDQSPGPNESPFPTRRYGTPAPCALGDDEPELLIPETMSWDDMTTPNCSPMSKEDSIQSLKREISRTRGLLSLMGKKIRDPKFIHYTPCTATSYPDRQQLQGRNVSSVCFDGYQRYLLSKIARAEREIFDLEEMIEKERTKGTASPNVSSPLFQRNVEISPCYRQRINEILRQVIKAAHIVRSQSSAGVSWDKMSLSSSEEREFQQLRLECFSHNTTLPYEVTARVQQILSNKGKEMAQQCDSLFFSSSNERLDYLFDQVVQVIEKVNKDYRELINGYRMDTILLKQQIQDRLSQMMSNVFYNCSTDEIDDVKWEKLIYYFVSFHLNRLDNSGCNLFYAFEGVIDNCPGDIKSDKHFLCYFAHNFFKWFDLQELNRIPADDFFGVFNRNKIHLSLEDVRSLRREEIEMLKFKDVLSEIDKNINNELENLEETIRKEKNCLSSVDHPALETDSKVAYMRYVDAKFLDRSYYNDVVRPLNLVSFEEYLKNDIDVAMSIAKALDRFRSEHRLPEIFLEYNQFVNRSVQHNKLGREIAEMYAEYIQEGNSEEEAIARLWKREEFSKFVCVSSNVLARRILFIDLPHILPRLKESANAHQKEKILSSMQVAFDAYIHRQERLPLLSRSGLYFKDSKRCIDYLNDLFIKFSFAQHSMDNYDIDEELWKAVIPDIRSYILDAASKSRVKRGKTRLAQ